MVPNHSHGILLLPLFIEGQVFSRSYDLDPRPPPPPFPVSKLGRRHKRRLSEKERQLADNRGRGRGGRGAESYERKKAWSFINRSILSAFYSI